MNQMSGSLIQGASKVLHEELQFDKKRVTSRDWVSYPILRFKDTPKVTTVIVHRPTATPSGSGEPPLLPASAAIPNAIFDATGVRMTQAPLTPARVRGFLQERRQAHRRPASGSARGGPFGALLLFKEQSAPTFLKT